MYAGRNGDVYLIRRCFFAHTLSVGSKRTRDASLISRPFIYLRIISEFGLRKSIASKPGMFNARFAFVARAHDPSTVKSNKNTYLTVVRMKKKKNLADFVIASLFFRFYIFNENLNTIPLSSEHVIITRDFHLFSIFQVRPRRNEIVSNYFDFFFFNNRALSNVCLCYCGLSRRECRLSEVIVDKYQI